jgi:hypothetical protein
MFVRANGQLAAKQLPVDHDSVLGCIARQHRLRVGVVDHGRNLANVAALNCSRTLFLGISPAVLDLNESGMGGNLPI